MPYLALYRKYRPRSFLEVAGQEHITGTLSRQVAAGRMSHAYMFTGTRGTGKTTCARILARAVNCLNPKDGNPCNECASCKGIEDGSILDIMEIDAASNNGVDNVRDLRNEAIYMPSSVKKRVYIIDEVHMLSTAAFNALLKLLEEPPPHILFILATTELHKVPATIQSRCQRFSFKRLPPEEIAACLSRIAGNEGLTITPDALAMLARLAEGSMRDGISLLDQCVSDKVIDRAYVENVLRLVSKDELLQVVKALAGRDVLAVLGILDSLYENGKSMAVFLGELSGAIRDMLVIKLSEGAGNTATLLGSGISKNELMAVAEGLPPEKLLFWLDTAGKTLMGLAHSGTAKIIIEMCLIRMSGEQAAQSPPMAASVAAPASTAAAAAKPPAAAPQPAETRLRHCGHDPQSPEIIEGINVGARNNEYSEASLQTEQTEDSLLSGILLTADDPALSALLGDGSKAVAAVSEGTLTVTMNDPFSVEMVKSTYADVIKAAAQKMLGREIMLAIKTDTSTEEKNKQHKLDALLQTHQDIIRVE